MLETVAHIHIGDSSCILTHPTGFSLELWSLCTSARFCLGGRDWIAGSHPGEETGALMEKSSWYNSDPDKIQKQLALNTSPIEFWVVNVGHKNHTSINPRVKGSLRFVFFFLLLHKLLLHYHFNFLTIQTDTCTTLKGVWDTHKVWIYHKVFIAVDITDALICIHLPLTACGCHV